MDFDRYAHKYDFYNRLHFFGRYDEFRTRLVTRADPDRLRAVLDFGCGTSENLRYLRANGFAGRYLGVDVSGGMLRKARGKFDDRQGTIQHVRIGKTGRLPLVDASVDAVFSALVFHLLPEARRDEVLSEFRRVLKPGGRVFMAEFGEPTTWIGRLNRWYILNLWTRFVPDEVNAEGLLNGDFPEQVRTRFPRVLVDKFHGTIDLISAST